MLGTSLYLLFRIPLCRDEWLKERQQLLQRAERGYLKVYSELTNNTQAAMEKVRAEVKESLLKAAEETRAAQLAKFEAEKLTEEGKAALEEAVLQRCGDIIAEYKGLAERAVKKASEEKKEAQAQVCSTAVWSYISVFHPAASAATNRSTWSV